ncbi:hypothetical protein [Embleya sp. NBC_00896]|uniref:hypothetical protein n=1 Tax=Embleya sp. NBC_00896 TaxID=2975961 RepID=UPI002F90C003|nr:hypothetical protein OG928_48020 [Embleya sp. NBC_00896]
MEKTESRISDPVSWLQAVHWGVDMRLPGFSEHTLRIARIMARLTECRPGVAYLRRATGLSERTVYGQLRALRRAGLLVYRAVGGFSDDKQRLAAVYMLVIPPMYDQALGIRIVGEGRERRMVGIGTQAGRRTIKRLARLTARGRGKRRGVRHPRPATRKRCTLGFSGPQEISAAGHVSPQDSVVAGESGHSNTEGSGNCSTPARRRVQSRVAQRLDLARDLIHRLPWLCRADPKRISWVVREVADRGWTCENVQAWIDVSGGDVAHVVRRPSGFLAARLKGAASVWDTPTRRAQGCEAWQDMLASRRDRPREWAPEPARSRPSSEALRLIGEAFAPVSVRASDGDVFDDPRLHGVGSDPAEPGDLPASLLEEVRAAAALDPDLVLAAHRMVGADYARRLYGDDLYDRAMHVATSRTITVHGPGGPR